MLRVSIRSPHSQTSDIASDKSCVGAYSYNPCWVCPCINSVLCCGLPVWREGGGLLSGLRDSLLSSLLPISDGKPFNDPAWDKGTNLRNEFEEALQSQEMKEVLLEAKDPKDCGGGMIIPSLPQILNQNFCSDINQKLLVPHGFRCEALFWVTYQQLSGPGNGRPDEIQHIALAIFKIDSKEQLQSRHQTMEEIDSLVVPDSSMPEVDSSVPEENRRRDEGGTQRLMRDP